MIRSVLGALALSLASAPVFACDNPWSGAWDVTATFANGMSAGVMKLEGAGNAFTGSSTPLDEAQIFALTLKGQAKGASAQIDVVSRNQPAGQLDLKCDKDRLTGSGALFGTPITLTAQLAGQPSRPPRTLDIAPDRYAIQYSTVAKPIAVLVPGDTVRTTTLDNEGQDHALKWRGMPGNTLTGPFLIEGAMPGDTLVVHLEKVALNRDSAKTVTGVINSRAIGAYPQVRSPDWSGTWILDRAKGVARLLNPGPRLANLEVPLRPIIGSLGVAAPLGQALYAGDLGFHGGNLDYNRVTTGATLYFPVWRGGAYFFLGDGHAAQGDGEISGQGLETSLDVTFRVELIKRQTLGQVWSEDAEYVMVSGIDNSLDTSLQMATSGMAKWLKQRHGLSDTEIAALLTTSIRYDIAEVVDPRPHVVARISKATLAMLAPAN